MLQVENEQIDDVGGSTVVPKIKVRLPKADISIYDFDDDDNSGRNTAKVESEPKVSPLEVKYSPSKSGKSTRLRLKVSGGKIVW